MAFYIFCSIHHKIHHNCYYYSAEVRGCSASLLDNSDTPQRQHFISISAHITIHYLSPAQIKI